MYVMLLFNTTTLFKQRTNEVFLVQTVANKQWSKVPEVGRITIICDFEHRNGSSLK